MLFILLVYFADEIVNIILKIGGTPYKCILNSELPPLKFANFNAALITLFEAAERYFLLKYALRDTVLLGLKHKRKGVSLWDC